MNNSPNIMNFEHEIWKDVPNYEGIYQVSNFGRIKRILDNRATFPGKILKPSNTSSGYPAVVLYKNGKPKSQTVHRLVGYAFLGLTTNLDINHKNLNKQDNNLDNLEVVTRKENIGHARRNGIRPNEFERGERNPASKLTEKDVMEIRELIKSETLIIREIANLFGVSPSAISNIKNGRKWSWLAQR